MTRDGEGSDNPLITDVTSSVTRRKGTPKLHVTTGASFLQKISFFFKGCCYKNVPERHPSQTQNLLALAITGAMNCEKASIYDVDTQTEEVGSIPKTCKPTMNQYRIIWDCTICKPGFTKNKETGQCEVLYENILGKHCSKFGKDDYTSHGRLSGAACQARCDADSDCLAYASKNNEWCVTYSKCTFRPGTQWGGKFFQHKTRAYEKIFGKHCSKFGNDDYTSHGRLGSAACQAKCDADSNCLAYASKNNEWCVTYSKCTFRPGTQWEAISFSTRLDTKTFC